MEIEKDKKIRIPVFLPVSAAIVILLTTFIIGMYWLQNRHITQQVQETIRGTQTIFNEYLKKDASMMNGMIDFIKKDENLQQVWLAKDRDKLFQYAKPIFEDIHAKYRVTHFYFVGTDGVCFLRVHNLSEHGDQIKRFTMTKAMQQAKPVYGIELGKFGNFTLRVVHPWLIDGKLAGYIELGEEIEHIAPSMKETLGAELRFVIKKSYLNRTQWEEGLKAMGRNGDWNLIPDYVVIDSTMTQISPKLIKNITLSHAEHKNVIFESSIGNRKYYNGFVQLSDADNQEVGDIIVTKDITKDKAAMKQLMMIMIAVCIPVCISLLGLLKLYIHLVERKIATAYRDLQEAMEKRKLAEDELRQSYSKIEQEVNERTTELQTANEHFIHEIAERKRAEEKLRRSETKYHMLYDTTSDAIMMLGDGKFFDCNKSTLEIYGCASVEEFCSKHPADFSPAKQPSGEDSLTLANKQITLAMEKGSNHFEWVHKRADNGKEFLADVLINAMELDGKKVVHTVVRDITERKRAEENMKELNSELEQAVKKLEETNQELKNFVYIASHDLREPLRKISAFGSMVQKSLSGKIDSDDAENLNFMIDGANRMTKMIEGLLAYSRVSSKANSAETVNLNDIVDQLRQLELSVLLEEKQTTIDVPVPLPEVDADPVQIRQLLQNLIANGMKYQAKDNVPHITLTSQPAANGMVRINITDNGIGIKPEFQQAIFIMFKRLHSKNEYEGTGIGLAVCKKIVEKNGGQIGVESEFGKGSTFWFTVPMAKNTAKATVQLNQTEGASV
ncbi:MAG: ATP-binding protein [Sedimentisphaerales bacterium]